MWRTNFDVFDETEVLNIEKKDNSQYCGGGGDYKEVNNSALTSEPTSPQTFPFEGTCISTPKKKVSVLDFLIYS